MFRFAVTNPEAVTAAGSFGVGMVDPHPPGGSPLDLPGPIDDAGRLARQGAEDAADDLVGYLFRGTTEGYPGNPGLQRIALTPTTTDPRIAALFASEAARHGEPIVLIVKRGELPEALGNVLRGLELEVGVEVAPAEFAKVATSIPLDVAKEALAKIGVSVPEVSSRSDLNRVLGELPPLTGDQIAQFIYEVLGK